MIFFPPYLLECLPFSWLLVIMDYCPNHAGSSTARPCFLWGEGEQRSVSRWVLLGWGKAIEGKTAEMDQSDRDKGNHCPIIAKFQLFSEHN